MTPSGPGGEGGGGARSRYRVQTQQQAIASVTASVDKGFAVFGDVLLVFAGVALFVAVFLIFNTFSILLAQRAKELALLRCLGATRRQLVATVLGESAVVGAVASVPGSGSGWCWRWDPGRPFLGRCRLPVDPPVLAARTVVVSLVVGTVATMGAALLPALRGARTSPVAAMRDCPVDTRPAGPYRTGHRVVAGAGRGAGGGGCAAHGRRGWRRRPLAEESALGWSSASSGCRTGAPGRPAVGRGARLAVRRLGGVGQWAGARHAPPPADRLHRGGPS